MGGYGVSIDQYNRIRDAVAYAMGAATNYPNGLPSGVLHRLLDQAMEKITDEVANIDPSLPF
jgi:hypothetical protein